MLDSPQSLFFYVYDCGRERTNQLSAFFFKREHLYNRDLPSFSPSLNLVLAPYVCPTCHIYCMFVPHCRGFSGLSETFFPFSRCGGVSRRLTCAPSRPARYRWAPGAPRRRRRSTGRSAATPPTTRLYLTAPCRPPRPPGYQSSR